MAHEQHRNTLWLILNTGTAAAAGLGFWMVLTRVVHLDAAQVGLGYSMVAVGTTIGLLAKGGLDTALLRLVPHTSRREADRLLWQGCLAGSAIAVGLAFAASGTPWAGRAMAPLSMSWILVAAIAILLVVTWLQDAFFLAEGQARRSVQRNLVASASRITLPFALVVLPTPQPVALAWAIALGIAAGLGTVAVLRLPHRDGPPVPRGAFRRSGLRNVTGSAAEFLPGLILAPIVLATRGAEEAAYFGIAWTAASLLFLASSAMSRSALAELVRRPVPSGMATVPAAPVSPTTAPETTMPAASSRAATRAALRRAALQHLVLVAPAALLAGVLAPWLLGIFGPSYAAQGAPVLRILCASVLVVCPAYLYLARLRSEERPVALVLFPAAMVVALLAAAPYLASRFGLEGVALAWILANTPFGIWAAVRLARDMKEVNILGPKTIRGRPHLE